MHLCTKPCHCCHRASWGRVNVVRVCTRPCCCCCHATQGCVNVMHMCMRPCCCCRRAMWCVNAMRLCTRPLRHCCWVTRCEAHVPAYEALIVNICCCCSCSVVATVFAHQMIWHVSFCDRAWGLMNSLRYGMCTCAQQHCTVAASTFAIVIAIVWQCLCWKLVQLCAWHNCNH